MKIKQLAGIIIAALVFVIVTVTGIYVNNLTDKKTDTLGLFGGKTSEITQTPLTDYIGLIRIEGTIMSEESGASVLGYSSGYSHKKVMSDIEMYMNDSMTALRSYDVLRAIDMLGEVYCLEESEITLYCESKYGVYGVIAAFLNKNVGVEYGNGLPISVYDNYIKPFAQNYCDELSVILPEMLRYFDYNEIMR